MKIVQIDETTRQNNGRSRERSRKSRKMRKKNNIEHEEIKRTIDDIKNDRTERETAQHIYKHQHNYNSYDMIMIQNTMEN